MKKVQPIAPRDCHFRHAHVVALRRPQAKNYWASGTKAQRRDYCYRQSALYGRWFAASGEKLMMEFYNLWLRRAEALTDKTKI